MENSKLSGGLNGITTEYELFDRKKLKKTEPIIFYKKDTIFAVLMLVCGFLYWNLISISNLGAGVSIFAAILCIITGIYFKSNGIHQTKHSILCLVVVILSAANFSLIDNALLKSLNFLFLSIITVYWICISTDKRIERRISITIIGDMVNQLIVVPFSNINCYLAGLFNAMSNNKHSKSFLSAMIGIIIFLPVLLIVTSLLIDADAAFESLIRNIRFSISEGIVEYIIQIIFGIPVACYLFGLVYGDIHRRHTDHITIETFEKNIKALQFVPGITVYSGLTVLNGIYVLFFISQASFLFAAFGNHLPETMTYSEYARKGFFELCMVAGINLCVIIVSYLLTSRGKVNKNPKETTPLVLKVEIIALCIFTIMLIATAIRKMVMYIDFYGLTQLRVYTTWFMLLIFLTFIIIIVRQFKVFNGFKIVTICFVILFMSLCYGNVDGMIANYNIDRYLQGTLESVDVNELARMSDATVPYMYKLYEVTDDEMLKNNLKRAIIDDSTPNNNFREFNLQKYKADRIRNDLMYYGEE